MRVVKAGTTEDHETAKTPVKTAKGGTFAKTLDEKRKVCQAAASTAGMMTDTHSAGAPPLVVSKSEGGASSPLPSIDHLANEIVNHLTSYRTGDVQNVDIQFKSQTLEGLGVHVQSARGGVTVSFVTQVESVAALLNGNLDTLRSALESKGVHVTSLGVRGRASNSILEAVNRNRQRQ